MKINTLYILGKREKKEIFWRFFLFFFYFFSLVLLWRRQIFTFIFGCHKWHEVIQNEMVETKHPNNSNNSDHRWIRREKFSLLSTCIYILWLFELGEERSQKSESLVLWESEVGMFVCVWVLYDTENFLLYFIFFIFSFRYTFWTLGAMYEFSVFVVSLLRLFRLIRQQPGAYIPFMFSVMFFFYFIHNWFFFAICISFIWTAFSVVLSLSLALPGV